jgi:hypothetical protein
LHADIDSQQIVSDFCALKAIKKNQPMSASEVAVGSIERESGRRAKRRPRSAVTSGRRLFVEGDSNSAWARRFYDLCNHHIQDISRGLGKDALSEAQLSLIKRASSIECELERLDALLSLGEEINLDEYGRATSHLRRLFEVLGVERKPRDLSPALTYRERLEIQAEAAVEEELVDGQ